MVITNLNVPFDSWDLYFKDLFGEKIAGGCYGDVYQHPLYHDKVVKITRGDFAYNDFVKFALRNQDIPFLPKIFERYKFSYRDKYDTYKCSIVVLEKLQQAEFHEEDESNDDLLQAVEQLLGSKIRSPSCVAGAVKLKSLKRDQKRFLNFLHKAIFKSRHALDLHGGNVMCRGSELVIIDPLA